jgi:uncharacterized protein YyaL (SSP411 family)
MRTRTRKLTTRLLLAAALAGCAALPAVGDETGSEKPLAGEAPERAAEPTWLGFGPAAFRRAVTEKRLVLLVLDAPWSEATAEKASELWTHPDVAGLIRDNYVPIRERADLRPDLLRRYPAEGWPAVSLLLPDGTPLVYDTADPEQRRRVTAGLLPPSAMAQLLEQAERYFSTAPERAIRNAREHMEKIRETSLPEPGPASETVVWGIGYALQNTFDKERRFFGGAPRLPRFDLLELLLTLSGEDASSWRPSALSAIDTLHGNLVDDEDGGLQRLALGLDWEQPQQEKLLDRNARFLDLLALAYRLEGRKLYRERGLESAAFMLEKLRTEGAPLANAVCSSCPGGRDELVLTAPNALAAAALIRAGASFHAAELTERGLSIARFLRDERYSPGRLVPRAVVDATTYVPGNFVLEDQARVTRTFLTAYEATGDESWLSAAEDLARATLANLRQADSRALTDIIPQAAAPAPLRVGLYPMEDNSEMARALVRLHSFTGDRTFKSAAREIISSFIGSFERFPLRQDALGLAVYEYFFDPVVAHVVARRGQDGADALRRAAMASPHPFTIVRSWDADAEAAAAREAGLEPEDSAVVYASAGELLSAPLSDVDGVPALIKDIRARRETAAGGKAP